jgi:hypothetical protein
MGDESVNRSVDGASEDTSRNDADGIRSERKGVMRGGHDPRELARLSAEARRARRQAQRNTPATPGGGSEEDRVHLDGRLSGGGKFSDSTPPADWTVEDARVALRDPGTPAYVKQKIREWVYAREQEQLARAELHVSTGEGPRAHSLEDVLEMAQKAGLELPSGVGRWPVFSALADDQPVLRALERAEPVSRGTLAPVSETAKPEGIVPESEEDALAHAAAEGARRASVDYDACDDPPPVDPLARVLAEAAARAERERLDAQLSEWGYNNNGSDAA